MEKKIIKCPKCRENNFPIGRPGYYVINDNNMVCKNCGTECTPVSFLWDDMYTLTVNGCSLELIDAMIELKNKDIIEFETKMVPFKTYAAQREAEDNAVIEELKKPKCPKCKSTNIQIVPRKWSFWAGVFTNKTDRVCANCKYKW